MAVNVNIAPVPKLQFSQNGVPLAGGKLYTYAAGTMTKQPTYIDSTGTVPSSNPIILDANGQCSCWLQQGLAYKLILSPSTDTDPPTNPYWTVDNVHGVNDLVSTYGVDTGVANAYAVSLTPAPAALEDGQVVLFQAANTNSGSLGSTLNLNGLGAKPILANSQALPAGVIVAGGVYEVVYNAALASFLLIGQSAGVRQLGTLANTTAKTTNGNSFEAVSGPNATPFALRNRVINGSFLINQRVYPTGGTLTAGTYGHDRWKAGAGGCVYTFTQEPNGQQITITSGTLEQVVEGTNVEGGTYTLSWSGTAQGSINGGTSAASPITVTGLASSTSVTLSFGTGTLGSVQLEPGPLATTFEQRPIGMELDLCQSYCQVIGSNFVGVVVSATTIEINVPFFKQMRAAATADYVLPGSYFNARISGADVALLNPGLANVSLTDSGAWMQVTSASGLTVGAVAFGRNIPHTQNDNFLVVESEL